MPRSITPAVAAQLEALTMRPALLVSCMFNSSTEYMWTGVGDLPWRGHLWKGVGKFASFSAVPETTEINAQGISLTLSGIPNDLLSEALTETNPGLPCQVFLGFFDNTGNLIPDPIQIYAGLMDQPTIEIGTETSTITIAVENRMVDLQRPIARRYTDADRRLDYPNDGIFKFVQQLQDWDGRWG